MKTPIRALSFLLVSVFVGAMPLAAQNLSSGNRKALVIGNSAYSVSPLKNPANDAADVAEALKKAGFEVQLAVNRTLNQMDDDLKTFTSGLKTDDVAFLYYAGHGVQADGENYLLPVDNDGIRDTEQIKRRAKAANQYVQALADAGTRLNIVILDACRNNPLPATSRSASRGLSIIAVPRKSETAVIFATKAGEVAADGEGRNSTYTTAFLQEIERPDVSLLEFFNNVGVRVKTATQGDQIPNVSMETISHPFFFYDSQTQLAQTKAASEAKAREVATLEKDIADRKLKIAAAKDASAKQNLEVEQQRQQALLAAGKLEAASLAEEVRRQKELADQAKAAQAEKQRLADETNSTQATLTDLATQRRAEIENLDQTKTEDPSILVTNFETARKALTDVKSQFDAVWTKTRAGLNKTYDQKLASVVKVNPQEGWEDDGPYKERIIGLKVTINAERATAISTAQADHESKRDAESATLAQAFATAKTKLYSQTYTIKGAQITATAGVFNKTTKQWPVTLSCKNPLVPFTVTVNLDLSGLTVPSEGGVPLGRGLQIADPDLSTAYKAWDTAFKAGGVAPEVDWGWAESAWMNEGYCYDVRKVVLKRLTDNLSVVVDHYSNLLVHRWNGKGALSPVSVLPLYLVEVSPTIAMGLTEVTQGQWLSVMKSNPSYFKGELNRPVEQVSWYDSILYCNALSKLERLTPAYTVSDTKVTWNKAAEGYRLPTREEWEDVARGAPPGSSYAWGANSDLEGWFGEDGTHPVGQKKPNGFGIYDMYGNVEEWIWDTSLMGSTYRHNWDPRIPDWSTGDFATGKERWRGLRLVRTLPPPMTIVPLVNVSSSLKMGRTEVTQGQWLSVMGSNPSLYQGDPDRPVEQVSWYDAVTFCNVLSQKEGLTLAYIVSGTNVTVNQRASGYRLPTKTEWEAAARGSTPRLTYVGSNIIDEVAWYKNNSDGRSHPVGQKKPNGLGLFDMSGSVWEWCGDFIQSPLMHRPRLGGSWSNEENFSRVAFDNTNLPDYKYFNLGFRIVRPQSE